MPFRAALRLTRRFSLRLALAWTGPVLASVAPVAAAENPMPRAADALPPGVTAAQAEDERERVVIVANAADAASLALAEHYRAARAIPAANVVALELPEAETLTWPEFTERVYNPLFRRLAADGWIDSRPGALTDAEGRVRAPVSGHRIAWLVLVRGVPLRIAHNAAWTPAPPPPNTHGSAIATEASVDSELALLAVDAAKPVRGYLGNPLYRRTTPNNLARSIVRVTRLDGPTPADVEALIDRTLAAERHGLAGRAYFDLGGPHATGDQWLDAAAQRAVAAGFDTTVDRAPATLGRLARADAAALYFGWYEWNLGGPFAAPGYRFPPGAIAVHIHSFSAETLRSPTANWCGPLVARGACATLGNTWEPYLDLSHHLDLFAAALLDGKSFGEAAYFALPVLSWQAVAIGDPLYRPFRHASSAQLAATGDAALPAALRPYVALRRAALTLRVGDKPAAVAQARAAFRDDPSVAIAASAARLALDADDPAAALAVLGVLDRLAQFSAGDVGAVLECAAGFVRAGQPAAAERVLNKLAAQRPAGIDEIALLEAALPVAREAKLTTLAAAWETRLALLRPPPPAPQG